MDISKILNKAKIDAKSSQPLYLQIANVIAQKIIDNTLPKGTRLPPERELGNFFKVSRTTAINSYRWLEQKGLVVTKVGSGTYVAESPAYSNDLHQIPWSQLFVPYLQTPMSSIIKELITPPSSEVISMAVGMPDPALYPLELMQKLVNKNISGANPLDFGYIPVEGYPPLRKTIASMLSENGIPTTPERTLILSGSQQGLYLVSKTLLERGDYVIVQSPTYIGAIQVFQSLGARLLLLPTSNGLNLGILEDFLIRYRPKLFYNVSTYNNPTGQVITEQERRDLLQLAMKHRLVIVEDDPYGQLYYGNRPPLPIKALDSYEGVVYIGTFSKNLAPGLRLGFLAGHPALINRLAHEKQYIDIHSNNVSQWLINLYLQQGYFDEHLRLVRTEYKKRRDSLVKGLRRHMGEELIFDVPEGGFYLWCKLPKFITANKLLQEASKYGVCFVPGQAFYPSPSGEHEIRLCFATHAESLLVEGAKRLGKAFQTLNKNAGPDTMSDRFIKPII